VNLAAGRGDDSLARCNFPDPSPRKPTPESFRPNQLGSEILDCHFMKLPSVLHISVELSDFNIITTVCERGCKAANGTGSV
jgi:hypothetical protein